MIENDSETIEEQTEETEIWTPGQLARKLGYSLEYIQKLCKSGEIPAYKLGKKWCIRKRDALKVLEEGIPPKEIHDGKRGPIELTVPEDKLHLVCPKDDLEQPQQPQDERPWWQKIFG